MTTVEAFTFTPEQFVNLINAIIGLIITVVVAAVGAAVWITYRISRVEKDMEHVLKNPIIKALIDLEEKQAKENAEKIYGKTLNTWEAEKKASSTEEGGDTSKQ